MDGGMAVLKTFEDYYKYYQLLTKTTLDRTQRGRITSVQAFPLIDGVWNPSTKPTPYLVRRALQFLDRERLAQLIKTDPRFASVRTLPSDLVKKTSPNSTSEKKKGNRNNWRKVKPIFDLDYGKMPYDEAEIIKDLVVIQNVLRQWGFVEQGSREVW
jgi:hypothetical protein